MSIHWDNDDEVSTLPSRAQLRGDDFATIAEYEADIRVKFAALPDGPAWDLIDDLHHGGRPDRPDWGAFVFGLLFLLLGVVVVARDHNRYDSFTLGFAAGVCFFAVVWNIGGFVESVFWTVRGRIASRKVA